MIRKSDRNGNTTEYGYTFYDAPLYRRNQATGLEEVYSYTPEGLLQAAIGGGMRYSYEYDEMGRLLRKNASGRALLSHTYDKNGNRISQTDVTGKTIDYAYDSLDILTEVYENGSKLSAYKYNPDGTVKSLQNGPMQTLYSYDLDKNMTSLQVACAGKLLADNQYSYDGNGNRLNKHQLGGDTQYTFDARNQLTKVQYPTTTEELFYDKSGNRTRRISDGAEELYHYDPRNRLTQMSHGNTTIPFRYDNAGNLLADDKALYSYDAFNRTTTVETFDGNVQINRYDAEGLRHELEENGRLVQFIFNSNHEVVAEENENQWTSYIRASSLLASSTEHARTYYHYASDEMGSTTHIVDDDGTVKNRYTYDAWGNITEQEETVPNRFKFNGQQLDPITQQYYLRARFYNPVIARFTQEDAYRGDGLNLYAYCANNPVYYVDPTGHFSVQCMKNTYDKAILEGKNKAEAYKAAKEAYKQNHGKITPRPTLDVPDDRSMTREQWNEAYRSTRVANATVMSWNEFQAANRGKYTNTKMSIAYANYSNSLLGANGGHYLNRPYISTDIRNQLAVDNPLRLVTGADGKIYPCPKPDIGHTPGNEFYRLRAIAEAQGMSQADFNKIMNSHPEFYQYEDPSRNRSHVDENHAPIDFSRILQ